MTRYRFGFHFGFGFCFDWGCSYSSLLGRFGLGSGSVWFRFTFLGRSRFGLGFRSL